ncbi:unnamed protein product [Effrenium voratum]|uniref:Uncharacterized protein n=1 Tax=Effrenium voratum TaxID=2562239 RepID=A0AA36J0A1_9DINO|nr:unnamed protein product [Effrenium voratum]
MVSRMKGFAALSVVIAVLMGALYVYENLIYLRVLHSLSPNLAAVAALQTENAFYYSYFQELVDSESLLEGFQRIIWDRRTEYPEVLNAIRRFNIYQEILLAVEYRLLGLLGLGFALPHPFDFFRLHIVVLNGVGQGFLCLLASEISGNPFAGLLCFLVSFLNRFQTSRLGNYTSSDLRELWGIPLLWVQSYLVWRVLLASHQPSQRRRWLLLGLMLVTIAFIVSWQFSPFLLLLQATALYSINIVAGFDSLRPVLVEILNVYVVSMAVAVVLHFGSPYLLTSPFFFQLVALKVSTSLCFCHRPALYTWRSWFLRRASHVAEGLVAVVSFLLVRQVLAPFATADTHVYEILCTKFQLPQNKLPACAEPSFNANLYLIMGVFKLLEWSSLQVYLQSTAAPAAAASCLLVLLRALGNWMAVQAAKRQKAKKGKNAKEEKLDFREEESEDAALLFFVAQFVLFLLLGSLVNRLRVAFAPPMMVLAVVLWGPRVWGPWGKTKAVMPILLLGYVCHGLWMASMLPCLTAEEGICQHLADKFSNDGDLADLYDWINEVVKPGTPVLASMNLAGSMRAFTHVPMIIHPQFESENLRKRVQQAYELYNCGSEESFATTMENLKAKLVIFEYSRCFFTPYKLDDKRKNCNSKKHQTEDLMCMKLHARSRYFKLMFMNGNYAVFQLRKQPLDGPRPKALEVRRWLDDHSNWQDYAQLCERTQKEKCGPRLMEAAAHFLHGLKKPQAAAELRSWALKLFPENGYVNYYQARFLDVDANRPKDAKPYYEKALRLLQNNPKVLTEVILYHDLVLQHPSFSSALVQRRAKSSKAGELSLLQLKGPGVGTLMCEAAVAAKSGGQAKLALQLWQRAQELAPLGNCVRNNWPIINDERAEDNSYARQYSTWAKVRMAAAGGVSLEIGPHHLVNVRFLEDDDLTLWPPKNKTSW